MEIKKFKASWNVKSNKGQIIAQLANGDKQNINFENPSEFSAILMILQGDEDCYLKDDGTISTGVDDVF